jgi:outer membrane protein insertion porin family
MASLTKSGHFNVLQTLLLIVVGTFVCGCNVTKHLDKSKGERLLTKNTLVFESPEKLGFGARTELQYAMGGLYKQPPNRRIFRMRPRLAAYYKFQQRTSKFARWVNTRYAEPPAIYNEELAERTDRNFENFMRQRGYFDAKCTHETTLHDKTAHVRYTLNLGPKHTIRNVRTMSRDTAIERVLRAHESESLIKPNRPMDGRDFDAERLRINNLLRNNGYARFVPNYIEITGDSTGTQTDVTIEILPQNDTTFHQVYRVDDVTVFYGLEPNLIAIKDDTTINGIQFFSGEKPFFIKPKYLAPIIVARPGDLYRQEDFERTNRNLSNMDAFRFVKVRPNIATTDSVGQIDTEIAFAPVKKFGYGGKINFNYSTGGLTGGLIGVSGNGFFQFRNLFRGAEQLRTQVIANQEFDVTRQSGTLNFSREFKFTNTLTLPRFVDYLGVWRGLRKVRVGDRRLVSDQFYDHLRLDNQTIASVNFNSLNLTNFYSYQLFNATYGYQLAPSKQRTWQITHLGVDFLIADLSAQFAKRCEENPLICRQFDDQLFTGFLLRNLGYTWASRPNRSGERWEFRVNSELSGLEIFALNKLFSPNTNWQFEGLDFAKFLRVETTGKYTRNITKDYFAGVRLSTGLLLPYGPNRNSPYVKQFFLGGPSSIRAWQIRELGPGTYLDTTIRRGSQQPFFQASDFKLEFNGEVRFPLFWWFKGAIFVDGGNIWSLRDDTARPGSQLRWSSLSDLALGTGAGLRFDFGYSQIRLDLGLQMRRPYANEEAGGRHWVRWGDEPFGQWATWNLAVGYPF